MNKAARKLSGLLAYPRVLVYLRQVVRELKRMNDLTEARLHVEVPEALLRPERPPKLIDVHAPTTEELNKQWYKQHPRDEEDLE